MASPNPLNVYRGPNSIRDYFDPDSSPPLPLVEIPDCLNPYRQDSVRIYAKLMTVHPANNVKAIPALNLLEKSIDPEKTNTVVEYSSGSTVLSMALIARGIYGIPNMRAFLSNKTSLAKIRLMQLFGIDITLFGGPSQPEATDERGGIRAAERLGQESESTVNPNQYENDDNWKGHIRWTGPQILKQLPEINVICAGMGTSGTMTGLGTYFKETKPSVFRVGVCTAPGDRVPGPRSYALLSPVQFPWRSSVDHVERVGSHDAFFISVSLCRQGILCGPSSGFALKGLFQMIEKRKRSGSLQDLAGPDGEIHCVFLCCDLPYQYVDEYFDKLGREFFPPIRNENLLKADLCPYSKKWEREAPDAISAYYDAPVNDVLALVWEQRAGNKPKRKSYIPALKPNAAIVDLRQPCDFAEFALPGAACIPFVHAKTPSPYSDSKVLESLWNRLQETLVANRKFRGPLNGKQLLVVCYDGDSSRVATTVLRAKGYKADSLCGGYKALLKMRADSDPMHGGDQGLETPWMTLSNESVPIATTQLN